MAKKAPRPSNFVADRNVRTSLKENPPQGILVDPRSARCPKCGKPVTSINEYGNKRFFNHGEGGSMEWKGGQTYVLRFDDYCTVEIESEEKQ